MLETVRQPLLEEARASPRLLADLAGLEAYVAESYDARAVIELLQNADDAGATRFRVERSGEYLIAANDGRDFTVRDFEGLCRSAASNKQRGVTIGYRGIGFKSVVGLASVVHVFSGDLETTFSRERTLREIPSADRVPLIRIPHRVLPVDRAALELVTRELLQDHFTTIFIFEGLRLRSAEGETRQLDPTCLLFLRNVQEVEVRAEVNFTISAMRQNLGGFESRVELGTRAGVSRWLLSQRDGICVAFAENETGIVRANERDSVVHAFLPTHEATGLGIKIHADFSTDPSRTRVVLDERTIGYIRCAAAGLIDVIAHSIAAEPTDANQRMLTALVPRSDPRLLSFERPSFESELVAQMVECATSKLQSLRLRPGWLNAKADFEALSQKCGLRYLACRFEAIEGLLPFLRACGAKEASMGELCKSFAKHKLSLAGAADIVDHLSTLHVTGQFVTTAFDLSWKLWPLNGRLQPLGDVVDSAGPLDMRFLDLVREKRGTLSNLVRLSASLVGSEAAGRMISENVGAGPFEGNSEGGKNAQPPREATITLKRWRSAEQQIEAILAAMGWVVRDVSKQNLGFDLEGRTDEDDDVYVEVKSVKYAGEPFTLTSNEEAVAREKTEAYVVAVVWLEGDELHTTLIRNPIGQMRMTRQCRQWVWLCEGYPIQTLKYSLS